MHKLKNESRPKFTGSYKKVCSCLAHLFNALYSFFVVIYFVRNVRLKITLRLKAC